MLSFDNLRVRQGEFILQANDVLCTGMHSVIGPSGCGKSTLLAAIAGFAPIAEGRMIFDGKDIGGLAPPMRPVAMVFQDNNLFPHLTVAQNVGLSVEKRMKLRPETRARVDTVLEYVGLAGLGDRKPAELSGGQQSRTALARVLLADKPILLLDEPFAALGPGMRREMIALVQKVFAEKLVLMVTHDPADAQDLGGRTILIENGIALAARATQDVFDNPPASLRSYLGT